MTSHEHLDVRSILIRRLARYHVDSLAGDSSCFQVGGAFEELFLAGFTGIESKSDDDLVYETGNLQLSDEERQAFLRLQAYCTEQVNVAASMHP